MIWRDTARQVGKGERDLQGAGHVTSTMRHRLRELQYSAGSSLCHRLG